MQNLTLGQITQITREQAEEFATATVKPDRQEVSRYKPTSPSMYSTFRRQALPKTDYITVEMVGRPGTTCPRGYVSKQGKYLLSFTNKQGDVTDIATIYI